MNVKMAKFLFDNYIVNRVEYRKKDDDPSWNWEVMPDWMLGCLIEERQLKF